MTDVTISACSRRQFVGRAVRLHFIDCRGPCQPANLACIKIRRMTVWLASLDDTSAYDELTARSTRFDLVECQEGHIDNTCCLGAGLGERARR